MTTEILNSPPHLPSSSSPIKCLIPTKNNNQQSSMKDEPFINSTEFVAFCKRKFASAEEEERGNQLSLLAVFLAVFRKSIVGCKRISGNSRGVEEQLMEIGWPSEVRHVAHVTFDRFNGFLGLPVEFEPEVPRKPPSASTRVFGVSTESMQLSFDSRGNCVPTILLMMQRRLYLQGGLQSEGIFRINPENGQEEYVREKLNNGIIPDNIDVHCLAGLIKAWFRELPRGVLDCLSTEQVMQAQTEDQCTRLVTLLPPTEAALLDWAVNLMADVAQFEYLNKMNARNVAMVFAPNMTQMSDPLTALMYAVQVMNFLKTLVVKTLREREDLIVEDAPMQKLESSVERGHYSILNAMLDNEESIEKEGIEMKEPVSNGRTNSSSHYEFEPKTSKETHSFRSSIENIFPYEKEHGADIANSIGTTSGEVGGGNAAVESWKSLSRSQRITKTEQLSYSNNHKKGSRKHIGGPFVRVNENAGKSKDISIIRRVNSRKDRGEAWR